MNTDTSSSAEMSSVPEGRDALMVFVKDLLAASNSRVNIEHSQGRYRLRYMVMDTESGRTVRRALELPAEGDLIETLRIIIRQYRQERKTRFEFKNDADLERGYVDARRKLRKRLLSACPSGRVIRRRLGMVFDIAADMGYPTLADFFTREPWLAKPFPLGRHPKKRSYMGHICE